MLFEALEQVDSQLRSEGLPTGKVNATGVVVKLPTLLDQRSPRLGANIDPADSRYADRIDDVEEHSASYETLDVCVEAGATPRFSQPGSYLVASEQGCE